MSEIADTAAPRSSPAKKQSSSGRSLEDLCINAIRVLSMDAVQKADSGHPGTPMALAPLAYVLWTQHLRYNPADPASRGDPYRKVRESKMWRALDEANEGRRIGSTRNQHTGTGGPRHEEPPENDDPLDEPLSVADEYDAKDDKVAAANNDDDDGGGNCTFVCVHRPSTHGCDLPYPAHPQLPHLPVLLRKPVERPAARRGR